MKRAFLFLLVLLITFTGVFADGAAAFDAGFEPVLSQQSLGHDFDITELSGTVAVPSMTVFCLCSSCSVYQETIHSEIGIFVNPSGFNDLKTDEAISLLSPTKFIKT